MTVFMETKRSVVARGWWGDGGRTRESTEDFCGSEKYSMIL